MFITQNTIRLQMNQIWHWVEAFDHVFNIRNFLFQNDIYIRSVNISVQYNLNSNELQKVQFKRKKMLRIVDRYKNRLEKHCQRVIGQSYRISKKWKYCSTSRREDWKFMFCTWTVQWLWYSIFRWCLLNN